MKKIKLSKKVKKKMVKKSEKKKLRKSSQIKLMSFTKESERVIFV